MNVELRYDVMFEGATYVVGGKVYMTHPLGSYDKMEDAATRATDVSLNLSFKRGYFFGDPIHLFHIDVTATIDGTDYVCSIPATHFMEWESYGLTGTEYVLAYMANRNIIDTHCVQCGQIAKKTIVCNECCERDFDGNWDEIKLWRGDSNKHR